ncbi:MAG: hypothetical protein ACRD4J_11015 [Nitrososphaeraceae archaeon]
MCLYHADVVPHEEITIDIAVANPGDSELEFPSRSTVVIGLNEIVLFTHQE